MSYKKLDERGNHPLSISSKYDVDNGEDHDLRFADSSTTSILSSSGGVGISIEEQNDRRASLSEPLSKSIGLSYVTTSATATPTSTNNNSGNGSNRIYDNPADPFYVFREDLYRKIELVDEALAEYLRVVYQTDSAANTYELKDAKKQLKRHIKNAESTLQDVATTVQVVENDRAKFHHVDDRELYDRSTLVQTSMERIIRAKLDMNSDAVKAKLLADERAKAVRRGAGGSINNNSNNNNTIMDEMNGSGQNHSHNDHMPVDSQVRTSLLMQHQDETLDELGAAVTRVGIMAENIHDEIGQQNKILTEMEEDLTNVEEELGLVMGKLAKLLKTKDSWQLGTIMCLIGIVILLFLMVLYT